MPRATWRGSISFGLVNVPVRLYSAVHQKDVHFHQLDSSSGARIRYRKVSAKSGREVPDDRIVKGYEIDDGRYVTVTDDELAAAEPERSHTITVEDFVPWDEIDPMHFESTYWIAPDDAKGAKNAYALLRDAMDATGRVAIGRYVMRTKEHLVALRPTDGAIALHGMLFPDEVIPAKDVEGLPMKAKASDREIKMARQLIESLAADWDPKRYRDTHREALLKLIKRKAKGEEITVEAEPREEPKYEDLMSALEASIKDKKTSRRRAARPTRKRTRARR